MFSKDVTDRIKAVLQMHGVKNAEGCLQVALYTSIGCGAAGVVATRCDNGEVTFEKATGRGGKVTAAYLGAALRDSMLSQSEDTVHKLMLFKREPFFTPGVFPSPITALGYDKPRRFASLYELTGGEAFRLDPVVDQIGMIEIGENKPIEQNEIIVEIEETTFVSAEVRELQPVRR